MRFFHLGVCLILGLTLAACPGNTSPPSLGADAGTVKSDAGVNNPDDAGSQVDAGQVLSKVADIRADVNRNGVVDWQDAREDAQEETWDATHGAIFLANIDDDSNRCPLKQNGSTLLSDKSLAACNDSTDEVVNGNSDLLDMAPLEIQAWPEAPAGTIGTLEIDEPGAKYVRLFQNTKDGYVPFDFTMKTLDAEAIRQGVKFYLEGKDIVRNLQTWDGYVNVHWTLDAPGGATSTDVVRLRVAPVMTFHHLLKGEEVYVTKIPMESDSTAFVNAMSSAVANSGISAPLQQVADEDPWTQDFFEPGYMSMPGPGGAQHVVRVNYRSANLYNPFSSTRPLRPAGVVVFSLRGPDVAALQEWDASSDPDMDSLNSFGNTETIPPYEYNGQKYPLGRLFRGSTPSFHPDVKFSRMMEAQAMQPPVYVDTSWLVVGHVDETISFLKANTPRGWVMLVNDPRLARTMLEDLVSRGLGSTKMFVGKKWINENTGLEFSAEVTVQAVLNNTDVMTESANSAAEVDAQVAILKQATGMTDAEIIHVPFLHHSYAGYSVAYQPGTVNSLVVNGTSVVAPETFGPKENGTDIFKKQFEEALAPLGYTVHWVDNWNLYHRNLGEVHCGSNTAREIPQTLWWETGR